MSRSVDLFIRTTASVDDVAAAVADAGVEVHQLEDGDGFALRDGDLSARLGVNRYLDEPELVLSRYPHVVSATTLASGHLGWAPETELLRRIGTAIDRLDGVEVLLVLDLQYRARLHEELDGADDSDGGPGDPDDPGHAHDSGPSDYEDEPLVGEGSVIGAERGGDDTVACADAGGER